MPFCNLDKYPFKPATRTVIHPLLPNPSPLSPSGVCRKQEDLVHSVRRRLEEALMADMLAHIEASTNEADTDALKEEQAEQDDKEDV